jgi:D-glycero-D-manno-heptose 1,7-bisphosphate phosphatase
MNASPTPKRAVFLDRDGVLNVPLVRDGNPYPPRTLAEFRLMDGVVEACAALKAAGFLLVVVTNQPDVGRGTQTRESVEEMHTALCQWLPLDLVEVCYHAGRGESCLCRKPLPGMLQRAAAELEIDLKRSYMVGDRWRDVDCGVAAGCTTIFIDHGYAEQLRAQPHFTTESLRSAAEWIQAREGAARS